MGCHTLYDGETIQPSSAIVSATILSFMGVIGLCGNLLVILVYCLKPRRQSASIRPNRAENSAKIVVESTSGTPDRVNSTVRRVSFSASNLHTEQTSLVNQYTNRHKAVSRIQVYLILCLATVDLSTCIFILPCDVLRSVLSLNRQMPNNASSPGLVHKNSTDSRVHRTSLTEIYLEEILTVLRNFAFACEGSILFSISLERFLTFVHQPLFCFPRSSRANTIPGHFDCFQICQNVSRSPLHKWTKVCLIWGTIILVSSSVLAVESFVLIMHFSPIYCDLAIHIRKVADRVYIVSTLASLGLVTYFYICVFIVVLQADLRKRRLLGGVRAVKRGRSSPNLVEHDDGNTAQIGHVNATQQHDSDSIGIAHKDANLDRGIIYPNDGPIIHDGPKECNRRICRLKMFAQSFPTSDKNDVAEKQQNDNTADDTKFENSSTKACPVPSRKHSIGMLRSRRTGLMLFISTVVFYATLLPLLWVHVGWWLEENLERIDTDGEVRNAQTVSLQDHHHSYKYSMGLHHEFYYVNNAINFFIYSLLNRRFFDQLKLLLRIEK